MDGMADGQEMSWRSQSFRANVRAKIEEAIRQSGNPTTKSVAEMETHVFQKAKSREEYLGFVARLIIHVREMNSKKAIGGGVPQPTGGMVPSSANVAGQVSDPMSALKSMAGQGSGGTVTIQSQPGQTQMTASLLGSGGTISQMPTPPQPQVQSLNPAAAGQNVMPPSGMNPMVMQQTRFLGPGGMLGPGQQRPQMMPQNMPMIQNFRGPGPPPPNVTNVANPMQGNFNDAMFMHSQRSPLSTQFQGHSPAASAPMSAQGPGSNQSGIPSPAGLHPASMGPQMAPSPSVYGQSPNPQLGPAMAGNYLVRTPGVPSPSSALNTPISAMPTQSPMNRNSDEEYFEKRKQLSRFIEPLKQMIANLEKDESKKKDFNRMKNLLDILTDPNKKCPMEVLLKCEQVLERMSSAIVPDGSSSATKVTAAVPMKTQEQDICQPLIDALNSIKKSPMFNQILQKAFLPPLAALFGTSVRDCYSGVSKKRKYEDEPAEITDILQGEIARLDQKFKVQFDPVQHLGSRIVNLICQLDDKNLPCVPSITITVPDNYPEYPPQCYIAKDEYESTPILQSIQKVFCTRISTMPQKYSITSLLDMWEMSVRQACASKPVIDEIYFETATLK